MPGKSVRSRTVWMLPATTTTQTQTNGMTLLTNVYTDFVRLALSTATNQSCPSHSSFHPPAAIPREGFPFLEGAGRSGVHAAFLVFQSAAAGARIVAADLAARAGDRRAGAGGGLVKRFLQRAGVGPQHLSASQSPGPFQMAQERRAQRRKLRLDV